MCRLEHWSTRVLRAKIDGMLFERTAISREPETLIREELQQLLDHEITLAQELFVLTQKDSRIGFEASNHYFYVPLDLVEKVINCDFLRRDLDAQD